MGHSRGISNNEEGHLAGRKVREHPQHRWLSQGEEDMTAFTLLMTFCAQIAD